MSAVHGPDTAALHRVLTSDVAAAPGAPASRVVEFAAAGMPLRDAEAAAYGRGGTLGPGVLRHALLAAVQRWLTGGAASLAACLGRRGFPFLYAAATARRALYGPGGDAGARRALCDLRGVDVPALCAAFVGLVARQLEAASPRGRAKERGLPACPAPAPGALLYCDEASAGATACAAVTAAWPARVAELEALLLAAAGDAGAPHGAK